MSRFSRIVSIFLPLLAFLVLAVGDPKTSNTYSEPGMTLSTYGDSWIDISNKKPRVVGLSARTSALKIAVSGKSMGSIDLEPVAIPIHKSFYVSAKKRNGETILTTELYQITENRTQVWVHMETDAHEENELEYWVSDRLEPGATYRTTGSERILLGEVVSSDDKWVATYEWIYFDGEWTLIIDPETTWFNPKSSPNAQVPFRYLGVKIPTSIYSGVPHIEFELTSYLK